MYAPRPIASELFMILSLLHVPINILPKVKTSSRSPLQLKDNYSTNGPYRANSSWLEINAVETLYNPKFW